MRESLNQLLTSSIAPKENWYALYIAIAAKEEKSLDSSLKAMGIAVKKAPKKYLNLTLEQALNLKDEKETKGSWEKLGEIYGLSGAALRMQVDKVIKKATKEPAKVAQNKNLKKLYHTEGGIQIVC